MHGKIGRPNNERYMINGNVRCGVKCKGFMRHRDFSRKYRERNITKRHMAASCMEEQKAQCGDNKPEITRR